MLAFDLDGVFLPDSTGSFPSLSDFLSIRSTFFLPLFQPRQDYYIITGRPKEDLVFTEEWVKNHLQRQPVKLFHDNPALAKPALYKAAVLNKNTEVTTYIESSPRQTAEIIKNLTREVKVIHFEELIQNAIQQALVVN